MVRQLSLGAILTMAVLVGCGQQTPLGKTVSGEEYKKAADATLTEEDRKINAQLAAEAAIPGGGKK